MADNPRIGKVLRIPIELIPEDETKVNEMINKLGKIKTDDQDSVVVTSSIKDAVDQSLEEITGYDTSQIIDSLNITKEIKSGNVKDLMTLSKEHISTLIGFAKNPSAAIMGVFLQKFAKGAGAIALAFIIMEAIQFAMNYLMRDGMPLDRRFKRYVHNEVFSFLDRLQKMQLRQGYRSVIVTSIGSLRGGQGQISGNLYRIAGGTINAAIPKNLYVMPTEKTKGNLTRGQRRYGRS